MEKVKFSLRIKIPIFLKGIISAFDLSGKMFAYPDCSGGFQRDRQAIAGDWQKVGRDLRSAMNKYE